MQTKMMKQKEKNYFPLFKKLFWIIAFGVTSCTSFSPLARSRRFDTFSLSCGDNRQEADDSKNLLWNRLMEHFQGDFDNYNQVLEDRAQDLLPREGGGHENFHCTLVPISESTRLAAFYFDANPQRIFRFRFYELLPDSADTDKIEMKLYTLHPKLEAILRSHSENPLKWPSLYDAFELENSSDEKIKYLPNCEITWSLKLDPEQHSYVATNDDTNGIHAVMVHGEAIVDSTIIPGMTIRILDQLSLYEDVFYINDRGLDPETGAFIYGNQRGVPYRLERVTCLIDGERKIVNEDLKWTMGPQWRTEKEYDGKIKSIGGPSAQMNAKPSKSTTTEKSD